MKTIYGLLALSLLAGCAGGPLYAPARGGSGFSEAEVAPGRWLVVFQGGRQTSAGKAFELAKVRAAELCIRAEKPAFRVVSFSNGDREYLNYDAGHIDRRSYRDADGDWLYYDHVGRGQSFDRYDVPVARLTVELLDEPDEESFLAKDILEEAVARGLVKPEGVGLAPVSE